MKNMVLQATGICKAFGGTKALDHVDFSLEKGEIHGLIGENGAGKSTLIKIISGDYIKDAGEIQIDGQVQSIQKPGDSLALGIRVISQEFNLMSEVTVAENICIGDYPCRDGIFKGIIRWKEVNQRAQALLDEIGEPIQATELVRNLSVAEQQTVEIAKALWKEPKILIMDEPTAALNDQETAHLFALLRRLRDKGVSIIFITHRLQEQFELTDRITVLRNGKLIGTILTKDATPEIVTTMMVGKDIAANYERKASTAGEVIYEVKNLDIPGKLHDINLKVRRGEIVSIFGLLGQGQDLLSRVLIGDTRVQTGEIWIHGKKVNLRTPRDAVKHKIGFVSEDRKKAGLLLMQTLKRNISIASMGKIANHGIIQPKVEEDIVNTWVKKLRIKCSSSQQPIVSLSGGNQQKALIARWLANDSQFIILNLPTRGVDIGAKYDIYEILESLCDQGVGVLVISLELPEVLGISDRIYIMRDGSLVEEFQNTKALNSDMIMASAIGKIEEKTHEARQGELL